MRRFFLLVSILLAGCGGGGGGSGGNPTPPSPGVNQWVDYGGAEPAINGNSFNFPVGSGSVVAGYFYTQLPAVPKSGQTLTLNYSVAGNNPVWQNSANGGDSGAPTLHLFLWHRGDDETCGGNPPGDYRAQYRMFAERTPLVLGANQTISVALDPTIWTGCYGANSTATQWSDLLNNLLGAGFTFGGQSFAGHGIYLSSGSAAFRVDGFVAK